jgi:hypothetical protein
MASPKGKRPSVAQIVEVVAAGSLQRKSDDDIMAELRDLGLRGERAEDALATVQAGFARAQLYGIGMKPLQFSGDFEKDPLFVQAVRRAAGASAGKARTK